MLCVYLRGFRSYTSETSQCSPRLDSASMKNPTMKTTRRFERIDNQYSSKTRLRVVCPVTWWTRRLHRVGTVARQEVRKRNTLHKQEKSGVAARSSTVFAIKDRPLKFLVYNTEGLAQLSFHIFACMCACLCLKLILFTIGLIHISICVHIHDCNGLIRNCIFTTCVVHIRIEV